MASTIQPLSPIPPPTQPLTNANGTMNRDWYLYMKRLDQHIREVEERLTAGGL